MLELFIKQQKINKLWKQPSFKYQYNLAFNVYTGKLLYLPLSNFYDWITNAGFIKKKVGNPGADFVDQ